MKVAIVHYHLRTGGVSRVVADQSAALDTAGVEHLILSAGPQVGELPQALVAELEYCRESSCSAEDLLNIMLAACEKAFGSGPDLWHFHNPTLGKHVGYPALIALLAERKQVMILQTHDFAEDNRPENYALLGQQDLYPVAPQIHYAFLNRRDQTAFSKVGLPLAQSHLLPNIIDAQTSAEPPIPQTRDERLVLYPVRGIRRKNLGEVLLLAALAPPKTRFAISLAPENEQWRAQHQAWQDLANELSLPVQTNVTDRESPHPDTGADADRSYESWREHATHFLTTSVAEGFGFTFLEPLAIGKSLLGRDLPEITCDFRSHGIEHHFLYQRLPIPLAHLDGDALRLELERAMKELYERYERPLDANTLQEAWEHLTAGRDVDFGNLPESFQEKLIREASQHDKSSCSLFPILREWLQKVLADETAQDQPADLAYYSPENGIDRLLALYQSALHSQRTPPRWLDREAVLTQFLHPHRFHFLRS